LFAAHKKKTKMRPKNYAATQSPDHGWGDASKSSKKFLQTQQIGAPSKLEHGAIQRGMPVSHTCGSLKTRSHFSSEILQNTLPSGSCSNVQARNFSAAAHTLSLSPSLSLSLSLSYAKYITGDSVA
jgi:hypothetical protein